MGWFSSAVKLEMNGDLERAVEDVGGGEEVLGIRVGQRPRHDDRVDRQRVDHVSTFFQAPL